MISEDSEQIAASFRKALNSHGHGFHYAVTRRAEELLQSRQSSWMFDGVEFPVTTAGHGTHIDFILRSRSGRTLIVAECKRADPARALWCFARSPYTWRNATKGEVIFDQIVIQPNKQVSRIPHYAYSQEDVFHLGFELKTGEKGEGYSQNRGINEAVTQVLRGTSGAINHLYHSVRTADHRTLGLNGANKAIRFIPALFTTAQIWVTSADLGSADLSTGDLGKNLVTERAEWIWFTHNRSPNLKPDLDVERERSALDGMSFDLRREFARSIAIVSPGGIDSFLCAELEEWLS
jgi:hypothetical protein